ncbi:hypothetical protein BC827DRAFT_938468 [Russula dissimulans]|nr:hypothetical protein BC827DRAFT_938468 [Russula dissimulans]
MRMCTRERSGETFERGQGREMSKGRAAMGGSLKEDASDYDSNAVNRVSALSPTPTTMSMSLPMSVPTSIPSPPRSTRPLAARKQPNDPAWFSMASTSVTSVKRQAAVDRAEGEPRNKRKRVEPTLQTTSQFGHRADRPQERQNEELPVPPNHHLSTTAIDFVPDIHVIYLRQMDFSTLPVEALHRYLVQYDLIPVVHPSPLSVHDPPPPPTLLGPIPNSSRGPSPPAVTTPANRPRRESREQGRRRSSRLLEEEGRVRTPVLADVAEVQSVLANIAQRHFESQVVKEVDSLASFMCAVKGRVALSGAVI